MYVLVSFDTRIGIGGLHSHLDMGASVLCFPAGSECPSPISAECRPQLKNLSITPKRSVK